MKLSTMFATLALAVAMAQPASAQVVIISAKNPISKLTKDQVSQLFLGQAKTYYNGAQAEALDLPEASELRKEFYQKTLGKPPAQMKGYWSKMEFSGNGHAPRAMSSAEVVKLVSENPKYIGYVELSAVTPEVKVVFTP